MTFSGAHFDLDAPNPNVMMRRSRQYYSNMLYSFRLIVLVLCIVFLLQIYRYFKTKGDDHARLEKFLKDYEALKPTRFCYADIKRITNHFKDKIGEGAHGSVFKGQLFNQIIVVRSYSITLMMTMVKTS